MPLPSGNECPTTADGFETTAPAQPARLPAKIQGVRSTDNKLLPCQCPEIIMIACGVCCGGMASERQLREQARFAACWPLN